MIVERYVDAPQEPNVAGTFRRLMRRRTRCRPFTSTMHGGVAQRSAFCPVGGDKCPASARLVGEMERGGRHRLGLRTLQPASTNAETPPPVPPLSRVFAGPRPPNSFRRQTAWTARSGKAAAAFPWAALTQRPQ